MVSTVISGRPKLIGSVDGSTIVAAKSPISSYCARALRSSCSM
jgi:hypothetical protein